MAELTTQRLRLVALTARLAALQADDMAEFLQELNAAPLGSWPPEPFDAEVSEWSRDGLARDAEGVGWYGWLVFEAAGDPEILIGAAVLVGRPDIDGEVELGFGLLPAHRGAGYAAETVTALTRWALDNGAASVIAHVAEDTPDGARALARCGFSQVSERPYPGVTRWVHSADGIAALF